MAYFIYDHALIISLVVLGFAVILGIATLFKIGPRWLLRLSSLPWLIAIPSLQSLIANFIDLTRLGLTLELLHRGLTALFWLVFAWFVVQLMRMIVARWSERPGAKKIRDIYVDIGSGLIFAAAGLYIMVGVFGKSPLGLVATSGTIGLLLGGGLQSSIKDLLAGLTLNLQGYILPGDWLHIRVMPADGNTFLDEHDDRMVLAQVETIDWRSVRLRQENGQYIIVPNAQMAASPVRQLNNLRGHFPLTLSVKLNASLVPERAKRLLAAAALDCTLLSIDAVPEVKLAGISQEDIVYEIGFWVDDLKNAKRVREDIIMAIAHHLSFAGLTISGKSAAEAAQYPFDAPHKPAREFIEHIDMFVPLVEDERAILAAKALERKFRAGETIVKQGDPGESLFALADGVATVRLNVQGTERTVARFRPGNVFGEMSFFTGEPRSATVAAATDVVVYEFTKEDLEPLLLSRPEMMQRFGTLLTARIQANRGDWERLINEAGNSRRSPAELVLQKMRNWFAKGQSDRDKAARSPEIRA